MKKNENEDSMKNTTSVERTSEREIVVTRVFNGPAHIVFEAWSKPALFKRWWVPASFGMSIVSCELDVRTGGTYRLVLSHPSFEQPMAFFGRYIEVVPNSRIVWTNEESADNCISTVTFEEKDGKTLSVLRELYPSKEALDDAIANGSTGTSAAPEQFELLDELLVTLNA